RFAHRLAELLSDDRRKENPPDRRYQRRHAPHRSRMQSLRRAPRARLFRRSAADRRAVLHELRLAEVRFEERRGKRNQRQGRRRTEGEGFEAEGIQRLINRAQFCDSHGSRVAPPPLTRRATSSATSEFGSPKYKRGSMESRDEFWARC